MDKRTLIPDARRIVDLRKNKGWTQQNLALKCGLGKRTIENVEAGRPVLVRTLDLLAQALGAEFAELAPRQPHASARAPASYLVANPLTGASGTELLPAFSPGGDQIAFSWNGEQEDHFSIYARELAETNPLRRLTSAAAEDFSPVWSPDGAVVAFLRISLAGAGIFLIPALGEAERKIADVFPIRFAVIGRQLAWHPDGSALAIVDKPRGDEPFAIFSIALDTGKRRRLSLPPADVVGDSDPAFSPDGETLALIRTTAVGVKEIWVQTTGSGATPLTSDKAYITGLAWTADGSEIVFSSNRSGSWQMWRVSVRGGSPRPVEVLGCGSAIYPDISRAGNRLAYMQTSGVTNIWRIGLEGPRRESTPPEKLISSARHDVEPQYSPDGSKVAFASDRSGGFEIWTCNSDGSNPTQLTRFRSPTGAGCPRWSPDAGRITFDCRAEGNPHIYVMRADGGRPLRISHGRGENVVPSWSHDKQWIYFASNRGGDWQAWRMTPQGEKLTQITTKGGFAPFESADGRFIYYAKGRDLPGIWRVPVAGGDENKILDYPARGFWGYWALAPKGIYFPDPVVTPPNVASPAAIKFFRFDTGSISEVAMLHNLRMVLYSGLALSPDGRWILYPQLDQSTSNVMVADNFV